MYRKAVNACMMNYTEGQVNVKMNTVIEANALLVRYVLVPLLLSI